MPEVVQTSNMDCGPASLKCLLEGWGIPVSYGRLREACQTGLDGTSIDTIEAVAKQLGLQAEQILLPVDHVFLPEAKALPALLVVVLPTGLTHFVVAWRRHGSFLQVMDPSVGRRWVPVKRFAGEMYRHAMPVPASDWYTFAVSDDFQNVLRARLRNLHIREDERDRLLAEVLATADWRRLAAFDAAVRLVQSLLDGGALRGSRAPARVLESCAEHPELIPDRYWSAGPLPQGDVAGEQVLMRGAVLLRVTGKSACAAPETLSRELAAAIAEKPLCPGRELASALYRSGPAVSVLLLSALLVAAGGVIAEAMLFRGLFDITQELGLVGQRLGALAAVLLFSLALLLVEFPSFALGTRLGRQIENRLRIRFLEKIPTLGDRYFQSRLTSDMAERSHATKRLRVLPDQVRQLLRSVFELCFTAAAIAWIEPSAAVFVCLIVAIVLIPAFGAQSILAERDLRVRSHAAGLTRFYLDAMLGLLAIRAHGGERNMKREHGRLLGEWAHAALDLQRLAVLLEGVQLTVTFALVAMLLLAHPFAGAGIGRVLLLVYWALNLPLVGQEIGTLMRQYPYYRNLTLRLLDPLGAPEEQPITTTTSEPLAAPPSIEFRDASVQVSGHSVLSEINVRIEAGQHIAIVGPSGAGKSSLAGLLLGWLKPQSGQIVIDGKPLDIEQLRLSTAWVDPAVQLWNRSLLANVTYGADSRGAVGEAIDGALLREVLENMPEGMQTKLGEGGALVSGGEGQRVRFARALLRKDTKVVILDEPFRGLDRQKRRQLLASAREFWRTATLVCITHDLSETRDFDRVIVIEAGRVVEQGSPAELLSNCNSRYGQLLDAEKDICSGLWRSKIWRRIHVHSGRVVEEVSQCEVGAERSEVA